MSTPLTRRAAARGSVRGERRLVAALLALAVLGAGGLWWSARQPDPRLAALPNRAQGAGAPQRAAFAILRSPTAGLPTSLRRREVRDVLGVDPALAHPLPIAPRRRLWLVPGRESLCLLAAGQAGQVTSSCAQTADALRHGVAITLMNLNTRRIVGVAPDSTRRVRLRTDGGSVGVAPVIGNVFDRRDHSRRPPDRFALVR